MKLELLLFAFIGIVVTQVSAQMDMATMLQMMGYEVPRIQLPPTPPKSLFPQLYQQPKQTTYQQVMLQKQQQLKEAQERQKLQQEMDLLRKLRAMSADEIKALQQKLSPQQLQQLISRIKYLQQVEQQHGGSASAPVSAGADAGSNMILSGANRIRSPGDQNAVSGASAGQPQGTVATASATTMSPALSRRAQYIQAMMAAAKKRMAAVTRPMEMLRKYQSYQKKSRSAMLAGCQYPMAAEGGMETFMAFSGGGCSTGGAICLMNGQSCVDVGMSIMCCPAGYTSGTLDMMNYMRQMEGFMAQFQ